ncbi:uncharacterized protein LOC131682906 [Topomyia yanbarensis]|uniref:uncharacterized protein LOC131682906 n=1 Tax=Topomyia yanbarensis TaxID=2498891 RepID=UPI00273A9002|nr:uncharacterized protein LOC131682906 [Topomyia yanbarensis]
MYRNRIATFHLWTFGKHSGMNPKGLKIRKQRSTGDLEKRGNGSGSIRSTASIASWLSTESSQSGLTNKSVHTDSNASFIVEDEQLDGSVIETYMGEWKNDKRCGYGISERSDGLKYEGEWFSNKKYGYGVTTFKDGAKEEGKYKNNVLITSQKKKHLFLIRSAKFRERIDAAVDSAQRASKYALQKADIAISRTATARGKAELADVAADHAREDSDLAIQMAKDFAPDFKPQLLERFERLKRDRCRIPLDYLTKSNTAVPNKTTIGAIKQNVYNPASMGSPSQTDTPLSNLDVYDKTYLNSQQQISNCNVIQVPSNRAHPFERNTQPGFGTISNLVNNVQNTFTNVASNTHQTTESDYIFCNTMQINQQRQIEPNFTDRQSYQQLEVDRYHHDNFTHRNSIQISGAAKPAPMLSKISQTSIDYFDHYKRPPSRDGSVDRYSRATSRLGGTQSRQSSVDRTGQCVSSQGITNESVPDQFVRAGSQIRGVTPMRNNAPSSGSISTGNGFGPRTPSRAASPLHHPTSDTFSNQKPFEEVLLRQRTLGQDIIPSPSQPKRTESLYLSKPSEIKSGFTGLTGVNSSATALSRGGRNGSGDGSGFTSRVLKSIPVTTTLQRKKSLPDVQQLPLATSTMSREEVSILGSARREEVRRQIDESERLKANPLLYLVSPKVKDWFSRQQLVMLVLIINIALAIMFFKMLT